MAVKTTLKKTYDHKRGVWVQDTDDKKRTIVDGHHVTDDVDVIQPGTVSAGDHGQPGDDTNDQSQNSGDSQDGEEQADGEGAGDGEDGGGDDSDQQQDQQSNVPNPQSQTSEEEYQQKSEQEQQQLDQQFNNKQKLSNIFERWQLVAYDNLVYMVNKQDPSLHVRFAHSTKAKSLLPAPNCVDMPILMEHRSDFETMTSSAFRQQFDSLLERAA